MTRCLNGASGVTKRTPLASASISTATASGGQDRVAAVRRAVKYGDVVLRVGLIIESVRDEPTTSNIGTGGKAGDRIVT